MTKHTEPFTILRRDGRQLVDVNIVCEPATPHSEKLGLAVRAAVAARADLTGADLRGADLTAADLRGADLRGAVLTAADLTGAYLTGAYLRNTNLRGAILWGEAVTRVIATAERSDGYIFRAFELQSGGVKIDAGCRWLTPAEYRAHIAAKYPGTDKARETGRILGLIEGRMADLGIDDAAADLQAIAIEGEGLDAG